MKELVLPHSTTGRRGVSAAGSLRIARLTRRFTLSAYVAAVAAALLSLAVLMEYWAGLSVFVVPGWPQMRPMTAFCMSLSAAALLLLQRPQGRWRQSALVLSVFNFALVSLVLLWPEIGEGFFRDAMARYTMCTLLLLQLGLFGAYRASAAGRALARVSSAAVLGLGLAGLLAVVFTALLHRPPLIQLSLAGGIVLVLLGYAGLVGRSDAWLGEQLISTRPAAVLIRRLLPAVAALPILLAVARVWAEHAAWIDTPLGVLIIMLSTIAVLSALVLWTASLIERAQGARESAQRMADAQREWLRVTLTSINDAVVATDADRIVRVINPAAEKLLDVDGEALIGQSLADRLRLTDDRGERMPCPVQGVLGGEEMQRQRVATLRQSDGRETPVEISTAPIRAADGLLLGGVMVLRDVSELQQNERVLRTAYAELDGRVAERTAALQQANAALHETLALFRGVAESTPDLIVVKNIDGRIVMVNPAAVKVLGRPEEELLGRRESDFLSDAQWAERAVEHDRRVIESGSVERTEQVWPSAAGSRTYLSTKSPLHDIDGEVVGLITVATDITERKRIENDLLEAQRFTQGLLDTAPLVLYLMDLQTGRIVFASGMVLQALGYTSDELLQLDGGTLQEMVHPEEREAVKARLQSYENEPQGLQDFELRFRHRAGDWRWLHCRERLFEGASSTRLALGVAIDVTDRRQAEHDLEQLIAVEQRLRQEAERANRAKDEFLAIVSHELRSPLNALRGWSFLLGNTQNADANLIERATQAIKRNVDHQARLIDDLLDTSRIMSGKLTLERRPLNLIETLNSAIETVRPAAAAKRIEIRFDAGMRSLSIDADPARLHQIVVNLLTNAVKFTSEEGRIHIDARASGECARFSVKDSGIGIDADFLPHVFDRFSQADTSTTRKHGGLGIGLALVRHLAELHGGRAWAESEGAGCGATFSVEIPLPRTTVASIEPQFAAIEIQNHSLTGFCICAVDDDPDARDIINATLRRAGATVHSASSGADLIAILDRLMPEECPDVLLLDLAMPGEDGFAVLSRVRALEKRKGLNGDGRIPAIAVTAFTDIDRSRVLEKGFAERVGKPVDPNTLVQAILRVSPAAAPSNPAG